VKDLKTIQVRFFAALRSCKQSVENMIRPPFVILSRAKDLVGWSVIELSADKILRSAQDDKRFYSGLVMALFTTSQNDKLFYSSLSLRLRASAIQLEALSSTRFTNW